MIDRTINGKLAEVFKRKSLITVIRNAISTLKSAYGHILS